MSIDYEARRKRFAESREFRRILEWSSLAHHNLYGICPTDGHVARVTRAKVCVECGGAVKPCENAEHTL